MKNKNSSYILFGLIILILIAVVGMTWGNKVFFDNQDYSDHFVSRWYGVRNFLIEGKSPYSDSTLEETQNLVYGSEAKQGDDPLEFIYPFYMGFLYSPFSLIGNLSWAQAIWMVVLEISLILIVIISVNLSRWRLPYLYLIPIFIFSFASLFSIYPLWEKDIVVLVVLFVTTALYAIRQNHDVLAGFLFTLAMFKPQSVVLLIIFMFIWAVSVRRWLIIWSFLGSTVILISVSVLIYPDWVLEYMRHIFPYLENPDFLNTWTVLREWLPGVGLQSGWVLSGLFLILLILEWRAASGKNYQWFLWTSYLTLVVTILIGVPTDVFNYIILLPAMIHILASTADRWGNLGRILFVFGVILILAASWGLFYVSGYPRFFIPNTPVMYFGLPIITIAGLYWIRWWAISKRVLPLHELVDSLSD